MNTINANNAFYKLCKDFPNPSIKCPFHNDSNASSGFFKINDKYLFKCFSCNITLDSFGFYKKKYECDDYKKYLNLIGHDDIDNILQNQIRLYNNLPLAKDSEYLNGRGITNYQIERFGIRLCVSKIGKVISKWDDNILMQYKLLTKKGYNMSYIFNNISTMLPTMDGNKINGFILNTPNISDTHPKYINISKTSRCLNYIDNGVNDNIIISEGYYDTISSFKLFGTKYNYITTFGLNIPNNRNFKNRISNKNIYITIDNNSPFSNINNWINVFIKNKIKIKTLNFIQPDTKYKDIDECITNNGEYNIYDLFDKRINLDMGKIIESMILPYEYFLKNGYDSELLLKISWK